MADIDRIIGKRIQLARRSAGYSVEDAADAECLDNAEIEKIEAGERRASADRLLRFAQLYQVSVGFFYMML